MLIEEYPDDKGDDDKENPAENKNEGVIHRYIIENEKETKHDTLIQVIE